MAQMLPHPDGRLYPWLACADEGAAVPSTAPGRYLIYQPFAGMCNQFSCLECAVALARLLGRTLVLPRWRPQYGFPWMGSSADYFDTERLSQLVRCITLEQFKDECSASGAPGAGVAFCRVALEYNATWSDPRGFELYPALRALLRDLEYFAHVEGTLGVALGLGGGVEGVQAEAQLALSLPRPLRGAREVSLRLGSIAQPVLALDHAFNVVALPSVLDAGERQVLLAAV